MAYEPPRPIRYSANCVKCPYIVSSKSPEEIQRALMDHVIFAHPTLGLRPVVDQSVNVSKEHTRE